MTPMRYFITTLFYLTISAVSVLALGSKCSEALSASSASSDPYWLESMTHLGTAPYANSTNYQVFRNVRDYGAKGDGITDDTAAINAAISDGDRCGLGCGSTTTTPAIIYFPSGEYLVSTPIIPLFYSALVGDPKNRPTLVAATSFEGIAVIDADPYIPGGNGTQYWVNQSNFFRAVRNFVIDLTAMPVNSTATGLHWQVSQATALAYVKVIMSEDPATLHQGMYMENGSGGFMNDLEFVGGKFGVYVGNQQFTVRNAKFYNNQVAIAAIWNWGWTWQNIEISNCGVGLQMGTGVGSELLLDFTVKDTPIFVQTSTEQPTSLAGSIYIDNAQLTNVPVAVGTVNGTVVLAGGTRTIESWAQGNIYNGQSSQGQYVQSDVTPINKPPSLLDECGKFFGAGRPQYEEYSPSQFASVKANGAVGDGVADDTAALQAIFDNFSGCKIIFFDAGVYVITDTLRIPVDTIIVGEMWSQILIKSPCFNDQDNPKVAVQFGQPGDVGSLQVSDMVFSTYAGSAGAIIMEINIQACEQGSVGFWDTHARLGGSTGTALTTAECERLKGHGIECSAAFLSAHITPGASAYMENMWLWTSDHTLDNDANGTQIDIFSGRGILIEGTDIWLYGTGSEHHTIYQYRFYNAQNVFAGLIQTESPYFQPVPAAPSPFTIRDDFHDPELNGLTSSLALSIQSSNDIIIGGAGLYSFFSNYTQECLQTYTCQSQIAEVNDSCNVRIMSLSTVGTTYQLTVDGEPVINQASNRNGFASTVTAWGQDFQKVSKKRATKQRRRTPMVSRMHSEG